MKKFRVQLKETFICYVDVEARNEVSAREIVEKQVEDCELIAPRDFDHFDRDISVVREIS